MTVPVLHLVFHPSAALDLRRALQTADRLWEVAGEDLKITSIGTPH